MLNGMSVDVEEHFQVSAFDGVVPREAWDDIPSRVQDNTGRLLDLFDESGVKATFFVLGWLGDRYPQLVRAIADRGHEIASHGYSHRLVYEQDLEVFRREVELSRRILQDASGQAVDGYRAASFSIGQSNLEALDVLVEAGFSYDSSIYPVLHDRYGMPGAPRHIHALTTPRGHSLLEVPPTTMQLLGLTLPVAGGGYLRAYPAAVSRWAIRRLNDKEGWPAIVYVHPWEFDPEQPRIEAPLISRWRHYHGLRSTAVKMRQLLRRFRFGPIREVIRETDIDTPNPFPPTVETVAGSQRS